MPLQCRILRQAEPLEWLPDRNIAWVNFTFVVKVTPSNKKKKKVTPSVSITALVMALSWCVWRTSTRRLQEKTLSMKPWWGSRVSWPTTLLSTWFGSRLQKEAGGHPSDRSTPLGKPLAWWENRTPVPPTMGFCIGNYVRYLFKTCWEDAPNFAAKI